MATNKRLIFVDKKMMSGVRVEEFQYAKISSIQYKTGMIVGKITIYTSGNDAEISQVTKELTRPFSDHVSARILDPAQQHASAPVAAKPAEEDVIDKLSRLGELRDKGVLTDEEFTAQKAKLLD